MHGRYGAVLVAGMLAWSCGGGPPAPPAPSGAAGRRVLVIGLDAADEDLLRPLVSGGRLREFGRFYAEGTTGGLLSHRPMLSPILWSSIATGVSPDIHGVLDFVQPSPAGGTDPIGSSARQVAAVWEILGSAGVKVGVAGWLATHPASPVNGWMVSDRLTVHPFQAVDAGPPPGTAGKAYPSGFYEEIAGLIVAPSDISDEEIRRVFALPPSSQAAPREAPRGAGAGAPETPGAGDRALKVVLASTRTYSAVAKHLLVAKRADFVAVYFDGLDRLLHLFSDATPPPLPGVDPARIARYGRVPERYLEYFDRTLAELGEAAGPGATILVVSDHGWRTGADRPGVDPGRQGPHAAEWHSDRGVLLARGAGIPTGKRYGGADIYDVTPTILAIYGVAPAKVFAGKLLETLFVPGFLSRPPVPVDIYPRSVAAEGAGGGGSAEERRATMENLRALGYIAGPSASSRARANLATVYLEQGKHREAIALYEEFLSDQPGDYDALYNLAFARRESGDPAGARSAYAEAARARPRSAEPWMALADMDMKEKRWSEAWRNLETARELEPRLPALWNVMGVVSCELGRVEQGVNCFRRAIELKPQAGSPWLNLSRVLDGMGRREEAMRLVEQGLAAAPTDERLRRRLVELQAPAAQGRSSGASEAAALAEPAVPEEPVAR